MLEKNFTEGMPKEGTEEREYCDKGVKNGFVYYFQLEKKYLIYLDFR